MDPRAAANRHTPDVQKMQLSVVLKRDFKNALIVEADVRNTVGKYSSLTPSLQYSNNGVALNIRGTLPFQFRNVMYNCPILVTLKTDYPMTPPNIVVLATDQIRIVHKHPNVLKNGAVNISYINQWNPRSTLVEALRLMQEVFNRAPPIYSIEPRGTSSTCAAVSPSAVNNASSASQTTANDNGSMASRSISGEGKTLESELESARRMITANVRDLRAHLIKDYQFDVGKYDIHRLIMLDWVPTCVDIGNSIKAQYAESDRLNRVLADGDEQLQTLEAIDDYFSQVIAALKKIQLAAEEAETKESVDEGEPKYNVEFESARDETLCRAVASEAAANEMLELVQATFKRKQISTKQYIHYVRVISNEKFRAMHSRHVATATNC